MFSFDIFKYFGISAPKTKIWSEILEQAVSDKGEVDYVWIKRIQQKLDKFITSFSNVDPEKWDEQEKSLIISTFYNASMIYNLLKYAQNSKIDVGSKAFLDILINKISVSGGNIWNGDYKVNIAGVYVNLGRNRACLNPW